MNKHTLTLILLIGIFGFGFSASAQFVEPTSAFVPPTCSAGSSGCNPGAPINRSANPQIKLGPLLVKRWLPLSDPDLLVHSGDNWIAESKKGDPLFGFETNALFRASRFVGNQAEYTKSLFLKFLSSVFTNKNQQELQIWKPVCSVGGNVEHCPNGFLSELSKNIPIYSTKKEPKPSVTLSANPGVTSNGSTTLSWVSSNADICYPVYGHKFAPNYAPTTPNGTIVVDEINLAPTNQRRYVIACKNLANNKISTDSVIVKYSQFQASPITLSFTSGMPKEFTGTYSYAPCPNNPKNTCKNNFVFPAKSAYSYSVYNAADCQTSSKLTKIGDKPASDFSPEAVNYYSMSFLTNPPSYPIYGTNGPKTVYIDPQDKYVDDGSNYQEYEYTVTCSNGSDTKSISTTIIHQFIEQ